MNPSSPLTRRVAPHLACAAALLLTAACETIADVSAEPFTTASIAAVYATPVPAENGAPAYRLEVELAGNASADAAPEALNLLARTAGGENRLAFDDGAEVDAVRSDGIYTAIVTDACVPLDGSLPKAGQKIGCKFEVVKTGATCGKWGRCPTRSILGGPTWFCLCVTECDFSIGKQAL